MLYFDHEIRARQEELERASSPDQGHDWGILFWLLLPGFIFVGMSVYHYFFGS